MTDQCSRPATLDDLKALLRAARQGVEEFELEIVIIVGRRTADAQLALVSERRRRRLRAGHAGAQS